MSSDSQASDSPRDIGTIVVLLAFRFHILDYGREIAAEVAAVMSM